MKSNLRTDDDWYSSKSLKGHPGIGNIPENFPRIHLPHYGWKINEKSGSNGYSVKKLRTMDWGGHDSNKENQMVKKTSELKEWKPKW